MAEAVGITLIKRFNYRGDPTEEWSNKYWLTGTLPADDVAWKAMADGLIANEKLCYSSGSQVVRAYGYADNSPTADSVWQHDYLLAGTAVPGVLAAGTGILMAGDQAGTLWWKTTRKTTRGKWIYLRKYFHDGFISATDTDSLSANTLAAYNGFADFLKDDVLFGRHIRSAAQVETIQLEGVSPWVTTRTLKRRGRRPS